MRLGTHTNNALPSTDNMLDRRRQDHKTMSVVIPSTCPRCTGILLEDENFYALQSLGYMISSECQGCAFFLEVAKRHDIDVTVELQTQILLRRFSKDGNLVDVYYVRKNGSNLTITRIHQLRLCAAFGMNSKQH